MNTLQKVERPVRDASHRASRPLFVSAGLIIFMCVPLKTPAMDGAHPSAATVSPYDRALSLYREGKFNDASVVLESELEHPTGDATGYRALLGWCRYRLGRMNDALESFKAALALSPQNADALEGVARTAARLGRDSEAIDAVLTLTRLHPEVEIGDVANQVLGRAGALSDRRLSRGRQPGADPSLVSRARGNYFEVRSCPTAPWRAIFVKGVNLGAALPGRYPAEFPRDKALYSDWIEKMSRMGANVVRLYTLLPPQFYRALLEHNASRGPGEEKLWLVQGVWTELPEDDNYDAEAFRAQFDGEIERVIDAVHGNIAVSHRRGHAFGLYDADVSGSTLAFILGREWEPYSVAAYDLSRPHPATFHGEHFILEGGTPTEAWFARVLDHAVGYETGSYNSQRPVAFTNWPTLDPITHPTE